MQINILKSWKEWNPYKTGLAGDLEGKNCIWFSIRHENENYYRIDHHHWELTLYRKYFVSYMVDIFPFELLSNSPDIILIAILNFLEDLNLSTVWKEENLHSSLCHTFTLTDEQRQEVLKRLDSHIPRYR